MPLEPIFPAASPRRIAIADKPLPQGGVISFITPEEFKEKFGCEFTETILTDEATAKRYQEKFKSGSARQDLSPLEKKIIERLSNPSIYEDLVICSMGGGVGNGVFARKEIPKGTILGVYSGTVEKAKSFDAKDHYACPFKALEESGSDILAVSAKERGNITRSFQHLPMNNDLYKQQIFESLKNPSQETIQSLARRLRVTVEKAGVLARQKAGEIRFEDVEKEIDADLQKRDRELASINFVADTRSKIATSNVSVLHVNCCGCPMIIAINDAMAIPEGAQIGFSYGALYWENLAQIGLYPELFYQDGSVVEHSRYKRSHVTIVVPDPLKPGVTYIFQDDAQGFIHEIRENIAIKAVLEGKEIPVSSYAVRDCLVAANAVDSDRFGALDLEKESRVLSLAILIKQYLATLYPKVKVRAYYQNPTADPETPEGQSVDLVCQVEHLEQLSVLRKTVFHHVAEGRVKLPSHTGELVLKGINIAHAEVQDLTGLEQALEKVIVSEKDKKDFAPFLQSIQKQAYSQALRRLCASTCDAIKVCACATALFDSPLAALVKVNEAAGEQEYTAAHHAARKGNRLLYALLVSKGADPHAKDKAGHEAQELFPS